MDIDTLCKLFRSMEPMSKEDELEDQTLTDDERDNQRFRESVQTNQWVKIFTKPKNPCRSSQSHCRPLTNLPLEMEVL